MTLDNPYLDHEMTREELQPALEHSADYLLRHQLPTGQFVYIQDPLGKCCRAKAEKYSLIRHLGAVFGLLRAYELTQAAEYLAGAKLGLDFATRFVTRPSGGPAAVYGLKGKPSIGENGFMLIAMTLHDRLAGRDVYGKLSDEIAPFVTAALVYDGPYATSGQWAECQAVIGLMAYYKHRRQDPRLLTVVRQWLDGMKADNRHSHWSIQAIRAYLDVATDAAPFYTDFAIAGGKFIMDQVLIDGPLRDRRQVGSRAGKFNSCNATARNEGLIAAYEVAHKQSRIADASYFLDRIKEHLAFALQFEYGMPGNLHGDDREMLRMAEMFQMRGGVFDNPKKAYVRIDFVSHHIRAIAAYLATGAAPTYTGLKTEELSH